MFQLPFLDQLRSVVSTSIIDDWIDMLSCFATAAVFLFGAIMISAKTYVGSPIQCWLPQTYSSQWSQYAETYCFLKNTFFVPDSETMLGGEYNEHGRMGVSYYQWSSMYLGVMAMVFVVPKFFWKISQNATDVPLTFFCETAQEIKTKTHAERVPKIEEMKEFLIVKVGSKHSPKSLKKWGMTQVYWATKLMYILNLIFQFVIMTAFLGQNANYFWGFNLLANLHTGVTWEQTGIFPRITYCSFLVRQSNGGTHKQIVQCVLGVNEFNEKIFLFIWFWILIVFILTVFGCVYISLPGKKLKLVQGLLSHMKEDDDKQKSREAMHRMFAFEYLKDDGILILSYVKKQSEIVATELAAKLYEDFKSNRNNKPSRIIVNPNHRFSTKKVEPFAEEETV